MNELLGEYITIEEAADILGVSTGRISQFLKEGRLVSDKSIGRNRLLKRSVVVEFGLIRSTKPGPVPKSSED